MSDSQPMIDTSLAARPVEQPVFSGLHKPIEDIPNGVDTYNDDVAEAPAKGTDEADKYDFVRLPNGTVVAVEKGSVHDAPAPTATQDRPASVAAANAPEAEFYVHLADGSVERVKESDLPNGVASNAPNGHWQRGKSVYTVIGVYPVEDIVKEG